MVLVGGKGYIVAGHYFGTSFLPEGFGVDKKAIHVEYNRCKHWV